MKHIIVSAVMLLSASAALACDFEYSPASAVQYYRDEGWQLPGTADSNLSVLTDGTPWAKVPNTKGYLLPHEDPYVVEFPAQTFVLNGTRQRLHPVKATVRITRLETNRHVFGYFYRLVPVEARREKGKWVIEGEAMCVFFATFIDDKGDGVFRVLARGAFTSDLIPQWAKKAND